MLDDKPVLDKILFTGNIPRSDKYQGKTLLPIGKNEFPLTGKGVAMRFQFEAMGQPVSFPLDAGRTKGMIFKRASAGS